MVIGNPDDELKVKVAQMIRMAARTGKIAVGILEAIISVRRRKSQLVIIAEDVDPKNLTQDLTLFCSRNQVPTLTMLSRKEIGDEAQIDCPAAAISIENPGADLTYYYSILKQIVTRPETVHEIILASKLFLDGNSVDDMTKKMRVSLDILSSANNLGTLPISTNVISQNIAIMLACSLCLAEELDADPLEYLLLRKTKSLS